VLIYYLNVITYDLDANSYVAILLNNHLEN